MSLKYKTEDEDEDKDEESDSDDTLPSLDYQEIKEAPQPES